MAQLSLATASAPGRRLAREAIVDANVHVWDTSADLPFPGGKPPESLGVAGAIDRLVELNKANSISQTLVVQPINYKYDHRYVTAALQKHPEMFAGEGLLDLTRGPEGVKAQMRDLASQGYSAFRLNPGLLPEGETLDGPIVDAVAETAAELKTPIAFLFFGGLSKFSTKAKAVVGRHPGCNFVIEQMGFFLQPATGTGDGREVDEASFTDLLGFARYPNVYVKVAALYRLYRNSADELVPRLQSLLDEFGAERLMWGSDFPFALDHGGIEQSLNEIEGILRSIGVTEAQRASILGATAQKLFFSGQNA